MRIGRLCQLLTLGALLGLGAQSANAAGTTPLALTQQMDINGQPLAGCLLYFFVAGTVATPQNNYQDFGLTTANPNPVQCDQTGRVPMHWLADGLIHLRLTNQSGVVQLDTTMQVLGPSAGVGGGGGTVDATTIAATGDIKFRMTGETLTGWVKLNGLTIGSIASGATGRASNDTQNLFLYLWTNCTDAHCPVSAGRGASGLADFNANKRLTLPDWRDATMVGMDCMGNVTCRNGLAAGNVTSGGSDGVDTAGAQGGTANRFIDQTNLPQGVNLSTSVSGTLDASTNVNVSGSTTASNVALDVNIPAAQSVHSHGHAIGNGYLMNATGGLSVNAGGNANVSLTVNTASSNMGAMSGSASGTVNGTFSGSGSSTSGSATGTLTGTTPLGGGGIALPTISPFVLGTWYVKL